MTELSTYKLPIKTLTRGQHTFSFTLDNDYFTQVAGQEIQDGEIEVDVKVNKTEHITELTIGYTGTIVTTCDRCLDPMDIEVDNDQVVYVKYGTVRPGEPYEEESDDTFIIPEDSDTFDIAWLLYEFLALEIPITHSHPEGGCNPEMTEILQRMRVGDIENESHHCEKSDTDTNSSDNIDPRWAALKDLIKN